MNIYIYINQLKIPISALASWYIVTILMLTELNSQLFWYTSALLIKQQWQKNSLPPTFFCFVLFLSELILIICLPVFKSANMIYRCDCKVSLPINGLHSVCMNEGVLIFSQHSSHLSLALTINSYCRADLKINFSVQLSAPFMVWLH